MGPVHGVLSLPWVCLPGSLARPQDRCCSRRLLVVAQTTPMREPARDHRPARMGLPSGHRSAWGRRGVDL